MSLSFKSQEIYGLGILPGLSLAQPINNDYKLVGEAYTRLNYLSGDFSGNRNSDFSYALTDFSVLLYKGFAPKWKWELGGLLRLSEESPRYRFIQGVHWHKKNDALHYDQRIRTDQTIAHGMYPIFRLRYRFETDFPIKIRHDNKHWRLKLSSEIINILQSDEYSLEWRWVALFKRHLKNHNSLEWGIDYRWANLFNQSTAIHNFWIIIKYDISLPQKQ